MINRILLTASFVLGATFVSTLSHAAELKSPVMRMKSPAVTKSSPTAAIIPCPSKLYNVHLSINSQYSAPSGWTAKTTPTGFQGQTLVISLHKVLSGKLHCTYAQSSLPSSYRLTTVSKPVPAGKSCTEIAGFKFSCQ